MLNLIDPVSYTPDEQNHVSSVLKPLFKAGWDDQKKKTKALKNRISSHTIIAQGGRCAYCETPLVKGAHAIEHIAPKGLYGMFCYEPFNLVTACYSCNNPSNKGEADTIVQPSNRRNYFLNKFKMVHPYFDNPDSHIKYQDADQTMYDKPNCSKEGAFTIDMFDWDSIWAYNQRVRNARTRDIPIKVLELVGEIATYKK